MTFRIACFLLISLLFLTSCHVGQEKPLRLEKTGFGEIPGWDGGNKNSLAAFVEVCAHLPALTDGKEIKPRFGRIEDWRRVCEIAAKTRTSDENAKIFFAQNFTPFTVTADGDPYGLFTGYYLPEIKASRTTHGRFIYPLYRLPEENDRNFTRAEIDGGALSGKGLELVYADDPVALFFLHLQGSGVIRLNTGEKILVGFAGKNNQPYHAIGLDLLASGKIERPVTAQKIKQWLYAHPGNQKEIMEKNTSYIFFREIPDGRPRGASGAAITPGYSLAVDSRAMPYFVPVWVDTGNFRRVMIAEDTGSGITGAVRGDIYFGSGATAEKLAGEMQSRGRYYVLLPVYNPSK